MEKIKNYFFGISGFVFWILGIILYGLILGFGTYLLVIINPILVNISSFCLFISIFILVPLSFFKKTRPISSYGILATSYVFGLSLWIFSFLVTYFYWGFWGIFIGLFLSGIGVTPIAIFASMLNSNWGYVGNITLLAVATFGSRLFSFYLTNKIEEETLLINKPIKEDAIIEGEIVAESSESKEEFVWTCDICGKEFDTQAEADEHESICEEESNNEEEVWVCDFCAKEFESKKESDEHEKTCDLNVKPKRKKTKVYCINCGVENPNNANFCKKCGNKIII